MSGEGDGLPKPAQSDTPRVLIFQGHSDDTFGLVNDTTDDFDNCASGKPIDFLVQHGGKGVIVTGQYAPDRLPMAGWVIGLSVFDPGYEDRSMPSWPAWFDRDDRYRGAVRLVLNVPQDAEITCLTRESIDPD